MESGPVSAEVHVSTPIGQHGNSGTSLRLLLISLATFLAAVGLLVLAGIRRRTR